MTVKERLRRYIKYKGISERSFCLKIGVSTAFVNSIVKSIQPDKIERITLHYPDLNTGWLLTGDGEMVKENNPNYVVVKESEREPVPAYVLDLLLEKDRMMHDKERELLKQNTVLIEQNQTVIELNASLIETLKTEIQDIKRAIVQQESSVGCTDAIGSSLVR